MVQRLTQEQWRGRCDAHLARVGPWLEAHAARRAAGRKHPVYDFLFEYYSVRPARLREWSPGCGVLLEGAGPGDVFHDAAWRFSAEGAWIEAEALPERRRDSLRWVVELLRAVDSRPAHFGCFGLHEWAMVYRTESVRHDYPLRMGAEELAAFVEGREVRCSHFDAFRFFTDAARPLNMLQPRADTRHALEQSGCVHVNMDLYKWAAKFHPWVASEVVADALELAVRARELDMRASPYDLRALGFEPVRIETPEGREEYARAQREISERATPLRRNLLGQLEEIIGLCSKKTYPQKNVFSQEVYSG